MSALAEASSTFLLSGPEFFANPYPTYAKIRSAESPVFDPDTNSWLVGRFAQVEALLQDLNTTKRLSLADRTPFERSVLSQDPPEHTRIRGVMNRALSEKAMSRIETCVITIADQLIDKMRAAGRCDFISAFALPLPVAIICQLLGIPGEDVDRLHVWSSVFLLDESVPPEETKRRQYEAIAGMTGYFAGLVEERSKHEGDDLISALIRARHGGDGLSPDELVGNCMLLLIAGHETTVNLLGNSLLLLLEERSRFEQFLREPEMLRLGIEEMLRFESPVQLGTFRVATEALEVGGMTIKAGEQITLLLGSANRDPAQFPQADSFQPRRSPNRHLAFGHGPHRCLGAALGRMEARLSLARILERLPGLRLENAPKPRRWLRSGLQSIGLAAAKPELAQPAWRHNAQTRGLRELWVRC